MYNGNSDGKVMHKKTDERRQKQHDETLNQTTSEFQRK